MRFYAAVPLVSQEGYALGVLSVWDRLFGSFRNRNDPEAIVFGLKEFTDPQWQSVTGLLKTPFVGLAGPNGSPSQEGAPGSKSRSSGEFTPGLLPRSKGRVHDMVCIFLG